MYWANFLHFYQPAFQQPDILEAVVAQSYRPILEGIIKRPKIKLTLNITGALLELFDKFGYRDLIDMLREAGKTGQVEFTSSAKYHAILPFLNHSEIIRQVKINDETNKFFLGEAYKPRGFFPPEMAYTPELSKTIEEMGFKWVILDEIADGGQVGHVDYHKIYQIKDTNLQVFFRERRLSNLIMSAVVRDRESLMSSMRDDITSNRYVLTAMDGETFGHHRPGLEKMLFAVLDSPEAELITISQIPNLFPKTESISPVASTWASSEEDIEKSVQFLSWNDPDNPIHGWQKELVQILEHEFANMNKNDPAYEDMRAKLDVALSSDHFFWASGRPWWSLEMIEDGAFRLLTALRAIPSVNPEKLERARTIYEEIVSTAFDWQRTGKIRKMAAQRNKILRIPFKERTVGRATKGEPAETGVYYAFIDMMKNLEKKAADKGAYEEAILWRDAIFKLENQLDIYDTINAIDLVRVKIPHEEVEKTVQKYKEKYQKLRGGQPEQRSN